MNYEIKIGDRFTRLIVVSFSHKHKGQSFYNCLCDCGNKLAVRKDALFHGRTKSCGCYGREQRVLRSRTHGLSGSTPEYQAWAHMLRRCHTSSTKGYENYGGRGITVCERWRKSFENFLADMGFRPSDKHSLDRINNNDNYEPSNCRWVKQDVQNNNTRRNIQITYNGETLTETQWRKKLGFGRGVIGFRIRSGWSVGEALTRPSGLGKRGQRAV
jgi:hypothetical protein